MPIEIKELVIRAIVEDGRDDREASPAPEATAELIDHCVREVLRVLKQSEER